jgi:hypothetical protein
MYEPVRAKNFRLGNSKMLFAGNVHRRLYKIIGVSRSLPKKCPGTYLDLIFMQFLVKFVEFSLLRLHLVGPRHLKAHVKF